MHISWRKLGIDDGDVPRLLVQLVDVHEEHNLDAERMSMLINFLRQLAARCDPRQHGSQERFQDICRCVLACQY